MFLHVCGSHALCSQDGLVSEMVIYPCIQVKGFEMKKRKYKLTTLYRHRNIWEMSATSQLHRAWKAGRLKQSNSPDICSLHISQTHGGS